jgi:hypothetical protein
VINFPLSGATATGAVRQACAALIRTMGNNLDGQGFTGVEAICGDAFFDALIMSQEVRATYLNMMDASELRGQYISGGQSWGTFAFGGISWTNYRGYAQGAAMVETDKAYFYPTGVPNLFPTVYAPADYIETVNTMGLPRYVKQYPMPNDKGINFDTQMNALNMCTKPAALQRATIDGTAPLLAEYDSEGKVIEGSDRRQIGHEGERASAHAPEHEPAERGRGRR